MYCTKCGTELEERDRFCSHCATATGVGGTRSPDSIYNRLSRSMVDKKIAGVCSGFARYFGMDVSLVRILWIVLALIPPFPAFIAYIVCWIVMSRDPELLPGTYAHPVRS